MKFKITFVFLALMPLSVAAAAEEWPTFDFRAGGYIATFNSDIRINDSGGIRGTDTDIEDVLDVDDGLSKFRLDAKWRFQPRHSLEFSYYDVSRDGRRNIDRELTIGDETYLIGTNIKSKFDFSVYKFSYAYSFYQTEETDLSVSLGLHAIDFGLEVKGEILNLPVNRESRDVVLPLPVLGVNYSRQLSGPFSIGVEVDLFAIEYGDYKGNLWDANLTLDVDISERFGAYLGYNYVDMGIESEDEDLLGELDYEYGAFMLGVRMRF